MIGLSYSIWVFGLYKKAEKSIKTGIVKKWIQPPIGDPFFEIWWDDYDEPLIIHPLMARFLGIRERELVALECLGPEPVEERRKIER